MKKRGLSLLLALIMVLSLLPAAAWAASPESVTAYVTVSVAGEIPVGRNGTLMAREPVTVTDLNKNGNIDIDDALRAAHDKYADHAHGYESAEGQYGLGITKLWGDTSGAFGYYVDNASASGLTDFVNDGDTITAYIYRDTSTWSDQYTYFDKETATAAVNGNIELTLSATGWSGVAPLENAQLVTIDPTTGNGTEFGGKTTDTNGQVALSFATAGTYYISATSSTTIVPPVCVVTVKESLSDADYVAAAKAQLTWRAIKATNTAQSNVTANLTLPSAISVNGTNVAVSWLCSDTTGALTPYDSDGYAYVDRPKSTDVETALTATLSYNGTTDTKTFDLTVKAEGVTTSQTVVAYGDLMRNIAVSYTSSKTSDPWAVLEMERYDRTDAANTAYTTALSTATEAKYGISALAQGNTTAADTVINHLKSTDNLSESNYIYAIPYILLVYDAAGADTSADCTNTRDDLVAAMVSYLNNLSTNGADADEVTPILAALAKYYNAASYSAAGITASNYNGVRSAVASAICWLSNRQNSDGTWSYYGTSCSESTSLAIVALSALGIDAHTDSRFIKNYNSAVEGLMSFALADKSGFGHKGNVTCNAMATEQGFRALVAYANFKNSGKPYNIYTDASTATAGSPVPAPDISVISAPIYTPGKSPITVSFTLVGDTVHGDAPHTAYVTWIPVTSITVAGGSTVGTVFTSVLGKNNYSYVGADKGYVSSITPPGGVTLSEKSNGINSGWMYSVNGVDAAVGLNDYALSNGDAIVWFYEDDYTTRGGMGGGSTEKPGTSAEAKYADVSENAWYKDAVSFVSEKGLLTGTGTAAFSPETAATRAMLVTILWSLDGKPTLTDGGSGFDDVTAARWYTDAVNWARQVGIITGYGDTFGPNDPVTREQLAAMLLNYAKYKGYDTVKTASLARYGDSGSVSGWALAAVQWANAEGLLTGRTASTIAPAGAATRAETAAIIAVFCKRHVK